MQHTLTTIIAVCKLFFVCGKGSTFPGACPLPFSKVLPKKAAVFTEATEKGVIPVLDAGIHLRKSLCCKEIDYRVKPDNDNFRSFSATLSSQAGISVISEIISAVSLARLKGE